MELDEELARKALDLPKRGPMNVTNGMGWKELAVIVVLVGGVGWGAMQLANRDAQPTPAPATEPADAGYDVRFYDAAGTPIRLDRWPGSE